MKKNSGYTIVIERGPNSYGAYVKQLPGCVAVGKTRKQAERLIKEAISLHLSTGGIKERIPAQDAGPCAR